MQDISSLTSPQVSHRTFGTKPVRELDSAIHQGTGSQGTAA